ncbi:hypothetical protein GVN16_16010 [Emticicia sp. CRIBPO]|uniref:hypothetical protein n=1 Tax=Emticicia sp. CRIBPO TaxID=2683258 RepID=UPI001412F33B|nr:hypothetical protein [Emticicia sp. CRIBPO]NBA87279.1 hypothetical protein [Emticicia sp. CRIBPO]
MIRKLNFGDYIGTVLSVFFFVYGLIAKAYHYQDSQVYFKLGFVLFGIASTNLISKLLTKNDK